MTTTQKEIDMPTKTTKTRSAIDVTSLRSQIGRALTKGFCQKSEWLPSGRVRGWGSTTEGYEFEGGSMSLTQTTVGTFVTYRGGDWASKRTPEQREEIRVRTLDKYVRVLTDSGFDVKLNEDGTKIYVECAVKA